MATGRTPLAFAAAVSEAARAAFKDGTIRAKVSPVTQELLKFWFDEPFTARTINFHEGQRQAILNAIYLHEVLGVRNVSEAYEKVASDLLGADGGNVLKEVSKPKYAYPKYLVKMATGTGKTWVMHALLIWQYLNAREEKGEKSGRWTKNFLFVAPGLIVYERLLDAFCGRRTDIDGNRNFQTSDIFETQVAEVRNIPFSSVNKIIVREHSSLELVKTIYTRDGYPAHGGGLEKACSRRNCAWRLCGILLWRRKPRTRDGGGASDGAEP